MADPWSEIALPVQGPAASDGDPVEVFPINQPSLAGFVDPVRRRAGFGG